MGADINELVRMPVREQIGRYKYTDEKAITGSYEDILTELASETEQAAAKEE